MFPTRNRPVDSRTRFINEGIAVVWVISLALVMKVAGDLNHQQF